MDWLTVTVIVVSVLVLVGIGFMINISWKWEFSPKCGHTTSDLNDKKEHVCRPAATPEPMSRPGYREVLPEVIKDFEARAAMGVKKYDFSLSSHNGRRSGNDALQEAEDLVMYLKQQEMERKDNLEKQVIAWSNSIGLLEVITPDSQLQRLFDEGQEWMVEVLKGDRDAEELELGDMLIVLINMAASRGKSLDQCGWQSLKKIENRHGCIIGTDFVKDQEVAPTPIEKPVKCIFEIDCEGFKVGCCSLKHCPKFIERH